MFIIRLFDKFNLKIETLHLLGKQILKEINIQIR